jgi:ubiquinone/menaquinone biosynthesis C-methylase UbiE
MTAGRRHEGGKMNQAGQIKKLLREDSVPCEKCEACDSTERDVIASDDRYGMGLTYVICSNCGFIYMDPIPSQEFLEIFYRDHYRKLYHNIEVVNKWQAAGDRKFAQYRFNAMIRRHLRSDDQVLEIGCGTGALLNLVGMESKNYNNCYGIEPNPAFAKFANTAYGLKNVRNGVFRFLEYEDNRFDGVIICHVLEHMLNPLNVLLEMHRILRRGGWLFIEVPDVSQGFDGLIQYHIAHVSLFSRAPLIALLRRSGFERLMENRARLAKDIGSFRIVAKKIDTCGDGQFLNDKERRKAISWLKNYMKSQSSKSRRPLRQMWFEMLSLYNLSIAKFYH